MYITARSIRDLRGGRSFDAALHLHGDVPWPDDVTGWPRDNPGRLIDLDAAPVSGGRSIEASLDVLAPDDTPATAIEAALKKLPEKIDSFPFVLRDGSITAIFSCIPELSEDPKAMRAELSRGLLWRLKERSTFESLRVTRVRIESFRGLENLSLVFSQTQTTVLVGANGVGKTAVLDALATGLSYLVAIHTKTPPERVLFALQDLSWRESGARSVSDDDIMVGSDGAELVLDSSFRERRCPVEISLRRNAAPRAKTNPSYRAAIGEDPEKRLPFAVYYTVHRDPADTSTNGQHARSDVSSEETPYSLDRRSVDFKEFFRWFREREDLENEVRLRKNPAHRDNQLEAIRRAIASLVDGISDLRVERAPQRFVVTKGDWTLFLDQLSDGEKGLLAMTGDIARRLAMANPLVDDPLQGSGVVLIDEIELHLHPGWQRKIIPALERTFPNCQLIVTTHSPQVLGEVDPRGVFVLHARAGKIQAFQPCAARGMDSNRILEDILGVPAQNPEFKEKFQRLRRHIDAGELEAARALASQLAEKLGEDWPELITAETLMRRREILGR